MCFPLQLGQKFLIPAIETIGHFARTLEIIFHNGRHPPNLLHISLLHGPGQFLQIIPAFLPLGKDFAKSKILVIYTDFFTVIKKFKNKLALFLRVIPGKFFENHSVGFLVKLVGLKIMILFFPDIAQRFHIPDKSKRITQNSNLVFFQSGTQSVCLENFIILKPYACRTGDDIHFARNSPGLQFMPGEITIPDMHRFVTNKTETGLVIVRQCGEKRIKAQLDRRICGLRRLAVILQGKVHFQLTNLGQGDKITLYITHFTAQRT